MPVDEDDVRKRLTEVLGMPLDDWPCPVCEATPWTVDDNLLQTETFDGSRPTGKHVYEVAIKSPCGYTMRFDAQTLGAM